MFSLLSLLDDIASTLDDIAVMSKVAIKKTSALMSDDLAVNAGVIHGVHASQELPMVWKIFIGSLFNKLYSIVGVLVLMAISPMIIKAILLIGGLYLSYEGAHKIIEKFFGHHKARKAETIDQDKKIKGAIRTDLILSIEIIVIAQSNISGNLLNQSIILTIVGIAASIIIYGLVALIVKTDDFGLYLIEKDYHKVGLALVRSMPYTMKALGIIGTLAMLLVGGGIIAHTFHLPNYLYEHLQNFILGLVGGLFICALLAIWPRKRLH